MGFLSDFFDDGSKDARRLNLQNMEWIKSLYGRPGDSGTGSLFGYLNSMYGKAEPHMLGSLDAISQGFGNARRQAAQVGAEGYRTIADNRAKSLGNMRSRAASSGLYNTSAALNMERGATADASRAAGSLASSLAGLQANLYGQQGQAMGGAMQNIGNFYAGQGQAGAGLGGQLGGLMGNYQFQPGTSPWGTVAPLLGSAVGGLLGKL